MPLRAYKCTKCDEEFERLEPINAQKVLQLVKDCATCGKSRRFERLVPNTSFILGGPNAVNGSGFHATDYGKAKSDLVKGRAEEWATRLSEQQAASDKKIIADRNAEKLRKFKKQRAGN